MADTKICLELSGASELLNAGVDAFVYQNGYTDKIINDDGLEIDNPITKLNFARNILRDFMRQNIAAYNINKAKQDAALIAEAATTESLDALTFEVKDE